MNIRIHPFLWWGIPVLFLAGQILSELLVPDADKPAFFSEEGPHEKFQALIMAFAVVLAARLFFAVDSLWLKLWYGIAFLGSLYVTGEEISWGQTYIGWATPESWGLINDQNETNFHNTSDWLDQKPKALLQVGVLVGGLIIPALMRWRPSALPDRFSKVYPLWQVSVTAAFAVLVKLVETGQDLGFFRVFWRASEVLEIYIYYFVVIYLYAMWRKLKAGSVQG